MYIEKISFTKKPIDGNGWTIDNCQFDKINLIAGQNSSGKTRLLKAIDMLISILSNNQKKAVSKFNFKWDIVLKEKDEEYIYYLEIENSIVLYEKLLINDEIYFSRDHDGKGQIQYESREGLVLDFEIEKDKIVLSSKRDKKQHPSLELIFRWINSVYMYNFGDTLGRNTFISPKNDLVNEDKLMSEVSKNDNAVVLKFEQGLRKYGETFKKQIIDDVNSIGYALEDINTTKLSDIVEDLPDVLLVMPSILYVEEKGISDKIFQQDISQGMFRVLSLIIQITYLEYELDSSVTILIDDIGEGLDFERATKLIKYIIQSIEKLEDKIQLLMTTNDRFVMNNIPLKYWIIINKQENGKIEFFTKKTHKKSFEDFEDIGLNNFDFFSGEYYKSFSEKD